MIPFGISFHIFDFLCPSVFYSLFLSSTCVGCSSCLDLGRQFWVVVLDRRIFEIIIAIVLNWSSFLEVGLQFLEWNFWK